MEGKLQVLELFAGAAEGRREQIWRSQEQTSLAVNRAHRGPAVKAMSTWNRLRSGYQSPILQIGLLVVY